MKIFFVDYRISIGMKFFIPRNLHFIFSAVDDNKKNPPKKNLV